MVSCHLLIGHFLPMLSTLLLFLRQVIEHVGMLIPNKLVFQFDFDLFFVVVADVKNCALKSCSVLCTQHYGLSEGIGIRSSMSNCTATTRTVIGIPFMHFYLNLALPPSPPGFFLLHSDRDNHQELGEAPFFLHHLRKMSCSNLTPQF